MGVTIDEARALVSDQAIWPLVRDFLWDFAPQVHESWLEGVFSSADCNRLQSTAIDSPRVKRFILETLEVQPCFHTFPKEDWSRLLLLDGATLLEICKWLGALACADSLRRITSGKVVRELKAALPGVYPEVFSFTMYFREFVSRRGAETQSLPTAIVEEGCSILMSVFSELPSPLVSRLKFKLPKGLCVSAPPREIKFSSILKLLKLKFPEAYSLCC